MDKVELRGLLEEARAAAQDPAGQSQMCALWDSVVGLLTEHCTTLHDWELAAELLAQDADCSLLGAAGSLRHSARLHHDAGARANEICARAHHVCESGA
jgi:hypothetical protein